MRYTPSFGWHGGTDMAKIGKLSAYDKYVIENFWEIRRTGTFVDWPFKTEPLKTRKRR